MRVALVNPNWTFDGSVYFGCRQPHLCLEFGYARALLEKGGHEAVLIDAHARRLSAEALRREVMEFRPGLTVVTTAPSYLFWRCAQPELKVPVEAIRALKACGGALAAAGPHPTVTPQAALEKTGVDFVIMGEPEELISKLAGTEPGAWKEIDSLCHNGADKAVGGRPWASDMEGLPALKWSEAELTGHVHHHHRFDSGPCGPGAEMETSRGCPYGCTFCARSGFRDRYRRRPIEKILEELDGLLGQGVEYVYFIDEIFMPDRRLLGEFLKRSFKFGVQTRIDLWKPQALELLGRAGCVSIEAGVESISEKGRSLLGKNCALGTEEIIERLSHARRSVPFVQATLMQTDGDDPEQTERWRHRLLALGIWANKPVPLFPYPGSREYELKWGAPDGYAWERANEYYISSSEHPGDTRDNGGLLSADEER